MCFAFLLTCILTHVSRVGLWEYFRSAFVGLPICVQFLFKRLNLFLIIIEPTSWLIDNGDCTTKHGHFKTSGKWNLECGFTTTRADWNERLSNWFGIHGLQRNRLCRQFGVSRELFLCIFCEFIFRNKFHNEDMFVAFLKITGENYPVLKTANYMIAVCFTFLT